MSETASPPSRDETIQQLTAERLDVLVIGGGIVGAGVARDAAMRGLRTGLVEQHDFASGTSSRTSRLLHGGIRYLAQGRVGLVRQASREKRVLHRIAPHLAEPLPFVFPVYRDSPWRLWQLRIGVKLYDLLCGGRNLGPSCAMTPDEVLRRLPNPKSERPGRGGPLLRRPDQRRAARARHASLRRRCRCGRAELRENGGSQAPPAAAGGATSKTRSAGRTLEIAARAVVHAAGPWAQAIAPKQRQAAADQGRPPGRRPQPARPAGRRRDDRRAGACSSPFLGRSG